MKYKIVKKNMNQIGALNMTNSAEKKTVVVCQIEELFTICSLHSVCHQYDKLFMQITHPL